MIFSEYPLSSKRTHAYTHTHRSFSMQDKEEAKTLQEELNLWAKVDMEKKYVEAQLLANVGKMQEDGDYIFVYVYIKGARE